MDFNAARLEVEKNSFKFWHLEEFDDEKAAAEIMAEMPGIEEFENKKREQQTKLDELETLTTAAEKVYATNRAELDRVMKRDLERTSRSASGSTESVISAVNQDWGFLVIGAGSNSGFTPQTPLIVQRDGKVLGRVRPSSIEPTQTIAEIDFDTLAAGVRIQPGDRVMLAKPSGN